MKPLISAYQKHQPGSPPLWLMRQAGRYLPEYRELRQRAGGFLDLVYTPDLAAEITLQPIRRFGMDGAILFSDILVIPHALGQRVEFIETKGPILPPIRTVEGIARLNFENFDSVLAPVMETIRQTRSMLARENLDQTTLIGFSGAPWTLACYMVEGGASRDFIHVKSWAYSNPHEFQGLIDLLTDAVTRYLLAQINAGVEAIQLFDSWAGILDHDLFNQYVIQPTKKIVDAIRAQHPTIPIIGFPRNAGRMGLDYALQSGISVMAIDQHQSPKSASTIYQPLMTVQGNLDPVCLLTGGKALDNAIDDILKHLSKGPFVFNLGHGVIKETPPAHVEQLVKRVRAWS